MTVILKFILLYLDYKCQNRELITTIKDYKLLSVPKYYIISILKYNQENVEITVIDVMRFGFKIIVDSKQVVSQVGISGAQTPPLPHERRFVLLNHGYISFRHVFALEGITQRCFFYWNWTIIIFS